MNRIRILSFIIIISVMISAFVSPANAEVNSPAYKYLESQTPAMIKELTLQELYDFYEYSDTDEILMDEENNYIEDYVSVGGSQVLCHVYMRTFSITDISQFTIAEADELAPVIFRRIINSISSKYLKCISRSFYISIGRARKPGEDAYKTYTVKFFIACGESNEQRREVIDTFVIPRAELWLPLDTGEQMLELNSFILNGQFSYDMTFTNRSSISDFIRDKEGVCEEYAGLTALFLDALGYENSIVTGKVGDGLHMWNTVTIADRVYHLDILYDGPVNPQGEHVQINTDYLLKSTESISVTHTPGELYAPLCKKAVYDFIFDGIPAEIPEGIYKKAEGILSRIPLFTTVHALKSSLGIGDFIEVFAGGKALEDTAYIATGCKIRLSANGIVIEELDACVFGDADGDGLATESDLREISDVILYIIHPEELSLLMKTACDVSEDGTITITDYLTVYKLAKNTEQHRDETA